jgi:hypothetical protein
VPTADARLLLLLAAALIPALLLRLVVPLLQPLGPRLIALITLPLFGTAYLLLGAGFGVSRSRQFLRQLGRRLRVSRNGQG